MSDLSEVFDRPVSVTHAVSVGFWIVGLLFILLGLFEVWPTGDLGLFVAGVGGVLTIRGYLCSLHAREAAAFEMGRDSAGVRALR